MKNVGNNAKEEIKQIDTKGTDNSIKAMIAIKDYVNNQEMKNIIDMVLYKIHKSENKDELVAETKKVYELTEYGIKAFEFGKFWLSSYQKDMKKIKDSILTAKQSDIIKMIE